MVLVPQYTDYKSYTIFFHDRDEYDFAVAAAGGDSTSGGVFYGMSPNTAANFFGIPIPYPSGNIDLIDKGITGSDTDGISDAPIYYVGGTQFLAPDDDDGIVVPPIDDGHLHVGVPFLLQWCGVCQFIGGQQPSTPTPTTIPQRRWIGGFEMGPGAEGGTGAYNALCREASRTMDGVGFAVRANNATASWTRLPDDYTGVAVRKSYERVYMRPRVVGAAPVGFWRAQNSVSPSAGVALTLDPGGTISIYTISPTTVLTLIATSPAINLFDWYKFDIFVKFPAAGAESGQCIVYLNGVLLFNVVDSSGTNLDTVGFHSQSQIGKGCGASALGLNDALVELDLDDWINADWPEQGGVLFTDSMDFLMGSHVRRSNVLSGTVVGWAPAAPLMMNQMVNPAVKSNSQLVSTTALALIEGLTDLPALGVQDKVTELAIGPVAAVVGTNSLNAGATDGQLGYSVNGAATMATVNQTGAAAFQSVLYNPTGLIEPAEITPFTVRHTKSNDVNSDTTNGLQAAVEYIGIWGAEDVLDPTLFPEDFPRINNVHNCNYPNTPYAMVGPTPLANVNVVGGTYVGNGTQQDIVLPDAAHMIFIRNVGAGVGGVKWFAAALGGHLGTTDRIVPNYIQRVWFDDATEQFKFTVTGTDVEVNQNAVTYQYIAFCDPGMRFCCAGAYNTPATVASRNNTLQNPDFLPEFAFLQQEILGSASGTQGLSTKGPGNAGVTGSSLNGGGAIANWGSFINGFLETRTDNHKVSNSQANFLAFRSTESGCGWVMCQILTYVGDGTASRNIALTPNTGGRFPLFALVIPASGAQNAIFRDPSHAGVNSALFTSLTNTATGIMGGAADQITVGISLNANGVTYNVFVIPGDFAGWNNGTFFPPNCDQPEPWYAPEMVPPDIAVLADGGLVLDGTTPLTLLKDVSGIYTLVPGKTNDTLIDRQIGQPDVDVKIPDPKAKTGYIGG